MSQHRQGPWMAAKSQGWIDHILAADRVGRVERDATRASRGSSPERGGLTAGKRSFVGVDTGAHHSQAYDGASRRSLWWIVSTMMMRLVWD